MFSFFHFFHLQRSSWTLQGRSRPSKLLSSPEDMRNQQQFPGVSGFQKPVFMTFFKRPWWACHSEMLQHDPCCRLGTGVRQWALGSAWGGEIHVPTLLANVPNARAQGTPGDNQTLMLSRGDQRADTVPGENPTGAHHCPRDSRFEPCLSSTHTLASSRWAGKIWRTWQVNHDYVPSKIFQLLVRKGLSLGIQAGRSSTCSGAGVGGRGRPMSKPAGVGVMQW